MKKVQLTNIFKKANLKINGERKLPGTNQVGNTGGIEMEYTEGKFTGKAPKYYEQISPLIISVVSKTNTFKDDAEMPFTIEDVKKVVKANGVSFKKGEKQGTILVDVEK